MPECSICRRSYDERFQVFIPPHPESFDRVECARQAARIWGLEPVAAVPVLLPTIVAVGAGAGLHKPLAAATAPPVAPRRAVAALAALAIAPGQVALTAGVGLFAAGSAASVYLAARPAGKTSVTAAPEHPGGLKVGMPSAAQPDAPGPVSVASSEATERPSVAANRPAHVTLHPTAVLAAAPRVHAVLSSREASTQLAARRITVQPLAPAEPSPSPTPADPGPSPTSTSPRPSATGTGGQHAKKEPKPQPPPGTVEPAAPPTATPPVVPEEPVAATSISVSDATTVVESRTTQGSNQSGREKPPSSGPPPPPPPTTTPPATTTPPPSSAPPPLWRPPPSTPPVTTPQQQPPFGDIRPGNGKDDRDHVHTGTPGHSGSGNGHHH